MPRDERRWRCPPALVTHAARAGNGTDTGRWYRDAATGHFFWEPARCRLRRLTGPQARRCLSGRHLHFAGDSLTR